MVYMLNITEFIYNYFKISFIFLMIRFKKKDYSYNNIISVDFYKTTIPVIYHRKLFIKTPLCYSKNTFLFLSKKNVIL